MKAKKDYLNFLETVKKSKRCKDQPFLIAFLRERNYRFTQLPFLKSIGYKTKVLDRHSKYVFMVRRFRETKNPYKEGYDLGIMFGFRLDGTRQQVVIYIHQEFHGLLKLEWPITHVMNVKKIDKMKFPKDMTIEERFDWRKENYKYIKAKSQEGASDFFLKWAPIIAELNPNHSLKP